MTDSGKRLFVLRVLLLCAAFGWGISAYGLFAPWDNVARELRGLGAENLPDEPMLDYWLRMTAGAFTAIGVLFLILAARPRKYSVVLPFAGIFMLAEGVVLLVHGLLLGLAPIPFYFDAGFCLVIGAGILLAQRYARKAA
jgi:FtsH-binding integral membrane protein